MSLAPWDFFGSGSRSAQDIRSHVEHCATPVSQSLVTNSPPLDLRRPQRVLWHEKLMLTRSAPHELRGKIEMFFFSTGACTAAKSTIAIRHSRIDAQLYSASITQNFRRRLFVKVEYASCKLLKTVSKSGPNGCKERSRPQKMLMRIKIEGLFGRKDLV